MNLRDVIRDGEGKQYPLQSCSSPESGGANKVVDLEADGIEGKEGHLQF